MTRTAPLPPPGGWTRYVALGDSFTEGLSDPAEDGRGYRGWADRLAGHLDAHARARGGPGTGYANLAVRGRLLGAVLDEQLPVALASGADLVSLVAGGNDVLRPGSDVDALAEAVETAVAALRATGADVLLATGADPRDSPVVRRTRGRAATYNAHLWSVAARHGCAVVDLWGMRALRDWRMWAEDRIHLAPEGHRRVALQAAAALGLDVPDDGWREPLPPVPPRPRLEGAREDARWAREHLVPWVRRRLAGRSSGDGLAPKRPVPQDWSRPALDVRD
ncbi:SGNH/GDSL hydrolase family protein [Vallicoccus soli]|uniref:SGNH/GDSL hydrolase family protein n=1 Tax=Vallicoccus soli TaxID=2339232 RepID=A0A3A3ZG74_9ACTN|nr:SGNH/GDSL hydrolase family protein [Vallicoccus soli]RJK94202.1 SGNH/GDSL hydrolase family protein [Vallicoccus soli]